MHALFVPHFHFCQNKLVRWIWTWHHNLPPEGTTAQQTLPCPPRPVIPIPPSDPSLMLCRGNKSLHDVCDAFKS